MLKIGIIGCGAIGSELARAVSTRFKDKAKLAYFSDIDPKHAQILKKKLKISSRIVPLSELVQKSDFIIEAASQKAALQAVPLAIRMNKKILVMSVGALLQIPKLIQNNKKGILYIPSGAIAGLDALLAAKQEKITRVSITTRKPLSSLKSAPFFQNSKWARKKITKPTVIFKGNAIQATKAFPQNINVAAALSLAGIGPKKTRVQIVASPTYTRNTHEVEFVGSFGRVKTIAENVPSRRNPKTSALAIASAIACLEKILSPIKIGT